MDAGGETEGHALGDLESAFGGAIGGLCESVCEGGGGGGRGGGGSELSHIRPISFHPIPSHLIHIYISDRVSPQPRVEYDVVVNVHHLPCRQIHQDVVCGDGGEITCLSVSELSDANNETRQGDVHNESRQAINPPHHNPPPHHANPITARSITSSHHRHQITSRSTPPIPISPGCLSPSPSTKPRALAAAVERANAPHRAQCSVAPGLDVKRRRARTWGGEMGVMGEWWVG